MNQLVGPSGVRREGERVMETDRLRRHKDGKRKDRQGRVSEGERRKETETEREDTKKTREKKTFKKTTTTEGWGVAVKREREIERRRRGERGGY